MGSTTSTPSELLGFPVPNIKSVIMSVIRPELRAIANIYEEEIAYMRSNIDTQNSLLVKIQGYFAQQNSQILDRIMKELELGLRVNHLQTAKIDRSENNNLVDTVSHHSELILNIQHLLSEQTMNYIDTIMRDLDVILDMNKVKAQKVNRTEHNTLVDAVVSHEDTMYSIQQLVAKQTTQYIDTLMKQLQLAVDMHRVEIQKVNRTEYNSLVDVVESHNTVVLDTHKLLAEQNVHNIDIMNRQKDFSLAINQIKGAKIDRVEYNSLVDVVSAQASNTIHLTDVVYDQNESYLQQVTEMEYRKVDREENRVLIEQVTALTFTLTSYVDITQAIQTQVDAIPVVDQAKIDTAIQNLRVSIALLQDTNSSNTTRINEIYRQMITEVRFIKTLLGVDTSDSDFELP